MAKKKTAEKKAEPKKAKKAEEIMLSAKSIVTAGLKVINGVLHVRAVDSFGAKVQREIPLGKDAVGVDIKLS